jgi:hypothetical protein
MSDYNEPTISMKNKKKQKKKKKKKEDDIFSNSETKGNRFSRMGQENLSYMEESGCIY